MCVCVYSIFFKIHFPRNKYRIVFTRKPTICLKLYFITHIKYFYKLHLHG